MFDGLWNWITSTSDSIWDALTITLCPVTQHLQNLENLQFLNTVNFFIPFYEMYQLMLAFAFAVTTYYTIMIALRWIKALGG